MQTRIQAHKHHSSTCNRQTIAPAPKHHRNTCNRRAIAQAHKHHSSTCNRRTIAPAPKHCGGTAASAAAQAHADHQTHHTLIRFSTRACTAANATTQALTDTHARGPCSQSIHTTSASLTHQFDLLFNFSPIFKACTNTHQPDTSASVQPLSATLLAPYNRWHSSK
jgi:hypothetical protein